MRLSTMVGFPLFLREKRRLAFTAKGRGLLPEVANALAALDSLNRLTVTMRTDATPRGVIGSVAAQARPRNALIELPVDRGNPGKLQRMDCGVTPWTV